MKRTVTIKLNGKEYPLCCTLGAVEEIENKYGSMKKFTDVMASDSNIAPLLTALDILLRHGARRARQFDGEEIEPVNIEEIRDTFDLSDMGDIATKVWEAINVSLRNELKAVSTSKKKAKE